MASATPGFAESLERKLSGLSNTMESIQGLSHWIIDHKSRSAKIVERWLKCVKKSPCEQRLNLFYLANDVVQNCKRKDAIIFRDAFAEVLPEATSLVRDISVRKPMERIFGIWEQREIFKKDFTLKLREILVNTKARVAENPNVVAEFRPDSIIQQLIAFNKFEDDLMRKETQAANLHVEFLSVEDFKLIKDQEGGMLFSNELEETSAKLEDFIVHLEKDIKRSPVIIEALEKAELFYEAQFKDVKIVVNAYTNFGSRVIHLKRRLEELIAELPGLSPMMSPPAGIPSPTRSNSPMAGPEGSPFSPPLEDIDLPDDDGEDTVTSAAADPSSKKGLSATVIAQSTISARALKLGNRQLHANKTSTIPSLPDLDLRKLSGVIGSFTGFSSLVQTDAANADVQDYASASPPAESIEGSDSETLSPSLQTTVAVSSSHSIKTQKIKSPSAKTLRSSTDSGGDESARHQCFSPTAEKQSTDDLETITAPESSSSSSLESRIHSMLQDNPSFLPFSLGSPVRAADENAYNAEESTPSSRTAFEGSSSPVCTATFEKPRVRRASMASNKSTSSIPSLTAIKESPIPSIASDEPSPIPSLAQNRTIPKYPVTPEKPAHIPTLMGIGRTEKQDEDNLFANERGSGTPTQDEPSDLTGFSQVGDATYGTFPQYAMTNYPLSNHMGFQSSQEPLQGFYSVEEERKPATRTAARKMSSNLLVLSNSCSNEDENEITSETGYSSKLGSSVGNTDDFQFSTVAVGKSGSIVGISSDVHSSWGYGASVSANQNQSQMAMREIVTTSPYSHFGYSDRPPIQSPTSQPPFHSSLASEIHHYMMSSQLNHTNTLVPPNTAAFELGPFAPSKPLPHQMIASPHQILPTHPTLMPYLPHLGPVLAPSAHQVSLSPSQPILPSHPHLILQQTLPVHTPTSHSVQTPPYRKVSSQSPVQHPSLPPGYVVAPHLLPTPSPKRPHFTPNFTTTVSTQGHSSKTLGIKQRASSQAILQSPSPSVPHSKQNLPHTQKLPSHHSRSKYSVTDKVHTTVQKPQKEDPKDGLEKNDGIDKTLSSSSDSNKNVESNKLKSPTQEIDANQPQGESDSGNSKEDKKEPPQNQPNPHKVCDNTLGDTALSSGSDKPHVPMPQEDYSKPYHKHGGFPNKIFVNHVSPSTVDFPPQPRPSGGHQYQGRGDFRPRALLSNPIIPFDGGIKRPGPPFSTRPSFPKRPFMTPPRWLQQDALALGLRARTPRFDCSSPPSVS